MVMRRGFVCWRVGNSGEREGNGERRPMMSSSLLWVGCGGKDGGLWLAKGTSEPAPPPFLPPRHTHRKKTRKPSLAWKSMG